MKNIQILSLLLFLTLSANAQSLKSSLISTENNINEILHINQKAIFVNSEGAVYRFKKISVNINGDVFNIDSLSNDVASSKNQLFNVLDIKNLDIKQKQFKVIYKSDIKNGEIFNINPRDFYALKKELYALIFICRTYSKLDPRFKCD